MPDRTKPRRDNSYIPAAAMPRYEDEYGRREDQRATAVRREVRGDDRHAPARVEPRERTRVIEDAREVPRSNRNQDPMEVIDPRMAAARTIADSRPANAGARLEPRPDRHGGVDPRAREQPTYYDDHKTSRMIDPRAADVYSREPVARYPNPNGREDRMDTRMDTEMDMQPPTRRPAARDVVDRGDYMDEDHRSNRYNEYFVPGTSIDREVISYDICRYLGNDATVRPYTNKDGRTGFVVRAYRALTTAMIDDLKKDSARWRQDQDRRSRQGRSTGSYAEMKGRQERQEADYGDTMEVDDYSFEPPGPRHRDIDPRDQRAPAGRHGAALVTTTGYAPEPYPAYSIGSNLPGNHGPEGIPRYGGNTTPPTTGRTVPPGYGQPGYPGRTTAAAAPPIQAYRDPRTGQMVPGYDPGYNEPGRPRHGR